MTTAFIINYWLCNEFYWCNEKSEAQNKLSSSSTTSTDLDPSWTHWVICQCLHLDNRSTWFWLSCIVMLMNGIDPTPSWYRKRLIHSSKDNANYFTVNCWIHTATLLTCWIILRQKKHYRGAMQSKGFRTIQSYYLLLVVRTKSKKNKNQNDTTRKVIKHAIISWCIVQHSTAYT